MIKIRRCCCKRCHSNDIFFNDINKFSKEYSALVLDVRSKQEFDEYHINGAINVPLWNIKNAISNIVTDFNRYIVVYCTSGVRSKRAQNILWSMGYKNVFNVVDGYYW